MPLISITADRMTNNDYFLSVYSQALSEQPQGEAEKIMEAVMEEGLPPGLSIHFYHFIGRFAVTVR